MTQEQLIRKSMQQRLSELAGEPNQARVRAQLADLRRGIGRKPGDLPELWGMLFAGMPEELLRRSTEPTQAEWAIYTALTLYALHQQSRDLRTENMHTADVAGRLGRALGRLVRGEEDRERVARRFNAFATASDMQEAAHYLRGLVQMLRAEGRGIPLDYVQLAVDLFYFQQPRNAPGVRLTWGRDFYWHGTEEKETKEGTVDDNE